MRFDLDGNEDCLSSLSYGERSFELSCFIPDGYSWEQVNYGQGEGQVLINGNEWGFYFGDNGVLSVVLHDGSVPLSDGIIFIKSVVQKVFQEYSESVDIKIVGDTLE